MNAGSSYVDENVFDPDNVKFSDNVFDAVSCDEPLV